MSDLSRSQSARPGSIASLALQTFSPLTHGISNSPLVRASSERLPSHRFSLASQPSVAPLTPASFKMDHWPRSETNTSASRPREGSVCSIGLAQFSPLVSPVVRSPIKLAPKNRENSIEDSSSDGGEPQRSRGASLRSNNLLSRMHRSNSLEAPPFVNSLFLSMQSNPKSTSQVINSAAPLTPASFGLAHWPVSEIDIDRGNVVSPAGLSPRRFPASEEAVAYLSPAPHFGPPKDNIVPPLTPASFGLRRFPTSELEVEHLSVFASPPSLARGSSAQSREGTGAAAIEKKESTQSEASARFKSEFIERPLASISLVPFSPFVSAITQSPMLSFSKSRAPNLQSPLSASSSPAAAPSRPPSNAPALSLALTAGPSESHVAHIRDHHEQDSMQTDAIRTGVPRSIFGSLNSANQKLGTSTPECVAVQVSSQMSSLASPAFSSNENEQSALASIGKLIPLQPADNLSKPTTVKDLFMKLPENERLLVRCIWVMCGKLDSAHVLQFYYRCLEFQRAGYLSSLEFLGIDCKKSILNYSSSSPTLALPAPAGIPSEVLNHPHKSCTFHASCHFHSSAAMQAVVAPTATLANMNEISSLFADMNPTEHRLFDGLFISDFQQQFHVISKLGKGSFGRVYKCMKKLDGHAYALKVIRFASDIASDVICQKQLREVQILAALPVHKNIVRYYHAWLEADMGAHSDLKFALKSTPTFVTEDSTSLVARFATFPGDIAEWNGQEINDHADAKVDQLHDEWDQDSFNAPTDNETEISANNSFGVDLSGATVRSAQVPRNRKLFFGASGSAYQSKIDLAADPVYKFNNMPMHCCCCKECVPHSCKTTGPIPSSALKSAKKENITDDEIGFELNAGGDIQEQFNVDDDFFNQLQPNNEFAKSTRYAPSGRLRRQPYSEFTGSEKVVTTSLPGSLNSVPSQSAENFENRKAVAFKTGVAVPTRSVSPGMLPKDSMGPSWGEHGRSPMLVEIENTNGSFSPGSYVLRSDFVAKLYRNDAPPSKGGDVNALVAIGGVKHAVSNQSQAAIDDSIIKISHQMRFPLRLFIQMELCEADTLLTWLQNKKRKVVEDVNMFLWTQIVEGVNHLHSNKWIHRDIKPGNIFVQYCVPAESSRAVSSELTRDSSSGSTYSAANFPYVVKIGDFGLAKELSSHLEAPLVSKKPNTSTKSHPIGTSTYASPEQLEKIVDISFSSDIYSLGIILFEMFQRFETAMERSRVLSSIRKLEFPADFETKNPNVARLVRSMLQVDPEKRPTARQLLFDAYVRTCTLTHGEDSIENTTFSKDEIISSLYLKNDALKQEMLVLKNRVKELEALLGSGVATSLAYPLDLDT